MRLMRLQSFICRLDCRLSGYLQRLEGTPFTSSHSGLSGPTVPQSAKTGFILSCLPLLYGVSLPLLPAASFESAPRCTGFCPIGDISDGVHSCGSSCLPATLRPRVFSTPRRFPPPFGFAGLLHPAATSRVFSVQGFLPIRSRLRLVAGACPHAVIVSPLTGKPAATN